jgi:hypothetical protein
MPTYYFAAWTDSGCLLGCDHRHATVISAVACIATCGGYVIAVEKGQLRELNYREEAEFQLAKYGAESTKSAIRRFVPSEVLRPLLN